MRFVGLNVPQIDPNTGQPSVQNPVEQMDVDIIIEDAPDQVSLAGETFASLVELARVGVPIPPMVFLQAAPGLRNKQQLLDMMEQAAQDPITQMAQQMELQTKQSDIELTQARTMKEKSQAMENMTDAAAKAAEASVPNMAQ